MFGIIKKMFIVLLTNIILNASNHTKCALLCNQKWEIQPTLINLHRNEYNQELHYCPFAVKLDQCVGSCDTLNDLSDRVCFPNKTKDLIIHVFKMITGKNESKIKKKNIYYANVNLGLMEKKCNSDQWWNNDKCLCDLKKRHVCEKDYIWNPATCSCQNRKYLASIIDDSACDENIDAECKLNDKETKMLPTIFKGKNLTHKTQNFYILLTFLVITIALLIAVSIYVYLIKH